MPWKKDNPGCPCCTPTIPCIPYSMQCVDAACPDATGRTMDVDLFEWLFVVTGNDSADIDIYRRRFSVGDQVLLGTKPEGVNTAIFTTNVELAEAWQNHKSGSEFCNPEEIRNAEVILIDRAALGFPTYSIVPYIGANQATGINTTRHLFLHGEDKWFNPVYQQFPDMLMVSEFKCVPYCIDSKLVTEGEDVPHPYISSGVPLSFDVLAAAQDSVGGVWRTCGTDKQRRVIVAKRVVSSQMEISDSLGTVKFSRTIVAPCSDFSQTYTHSTTWELRFGGGYYGGGSFSGTYPGVFVGGPSLPDGTNEDPNPYACNKRPHTLFYGLPVQVDLIRTQTVSRTLGDNCDQLICPEVAQVTTLYTGYARLAGHFARDTCITNATTAATLPVINAVLYRTSDNAIVPHSPNCKTMAALIAEHLFHGSPTLMGMTIGTNLGALQAGGCFTSGGAANFTFQTITIGNHRIRWGFPGVWFEEENTQVNSSQSQGTRFFDNWYPSTWDSPPSLENIGPNYSLFDPNYKWGIGTSTPGLEPNDYRTFYCPPCPPVCPGSPNDVSRQDIDVNISCSHTSGNLTTAYSANVSVTAARSAIIEGGGVL